MSEIKTEEKRAIRGGEFLVKETNPNEIFIPEEWNEEQRMIEQMCYDFMKAELFPILDKIDSMSDPELMPTLMQKAGELGLLGLSVPEEYGGLGVDYSAYENLYSRLKEAESYSDDEYKCVIKWSKIKDQGNNGRSYQRCYGTPFFLQMSGSGMVAPCGSLFNEKYKKFHIGNICDKRFKEILS